MFSRIYFRIFCYPTEDENKVKDALLFVAFGEMDPSFQQNIQLKVSSDKHKFPLVFEVILEKNRDIKKFSTRILQISLPAGLEERIDDHCYLFLRFSKQDAFQKKLVVIEQVVYFHRSISLPYKSLNNFRANQIGAGRVLLSEKK